MTITTDASQHTCSSEIEAANTGQKHISQGTFGTNKSPVDFEIGGRVLIENTSLKLKEEILWYRATSSAFNRGEGFHI